MNKEQAIVLAASILIVLSVLVVWLDIHGAVEKTVYILDGCFGVAALFTPFAKLLGGDRGHQGKGKN